MESATVVNSAWKAHMFMLVTQAYHQRILIRWKDFYLNMLKETEITDAFFRANLDDHLRGVAISVADLIWVLVIVQ